MFVLPATAALWFLPFVLPISLWVAWSDMAFMKIPNKAVLALTAVFAVVGIMALPLTVWAWAWLHLVVVLVIGFILSSLNLMGAGDSKFAAAMAPFIAFGDVGRFAMMFSAVLIATFILHRIARAIPAVRALAPNWVSWTHKKFPMGISLASALVIYLGLAAAQ